MKESLSHTLWECKYHVVWVPKNRRKVIFGKLRKEIGIILRKLCEYKGVKLLEGTACIDHIHVFFTVPPKYSISTIVGYLKGKSAMILFEKYTNFKRNFKGQSFWARGYYVNTVGLDEAKVRQYIKNQEVNEALGEKHGQESDPFRDASNIC
ncbi:MAG: IS200/IS605 family transposase [Candidatus Riflebacteria bacterium]|nr:IS200/IS605 family transposase [Candidatus Riflebacteria bacterium]